MSTPEPPTSFLDTDASTSQSDIFANALLDTLQKAYSQESIPPPSVPVPATATHLQVPMCMPVKRVPAQETFTLSEFAEGDEWANLPPEVAQADIRLAPDQSFVETTSGLAARELKRRFDRLHGVGKDVRSPYIISSMINQHGKQVYRVGHRENFRVDGASTHPEPVAPVSGPSSPPNGSRHPSRRSRMSFNGTSIPSAMKANLASILDTNQPPYHSKSRSPPAGPRKLRKTRSTSNLDAGGSTVPESTTSSQVPPPTGGRAHSHSVTAADLPQYAGRGRAEGSRPSGDMFSHTMGWPGYGPPTLASWANSSSRSHLSSSRSRHSYTGSLESPTKHVIEHPFGQNITFDAPFQTSSTQHLPPPPTLRFVQSFESGLTARAEPRDRVVDIPPRLDSPVSFLSLASSSEDSPTPPSPEHATEQLPETSKVQSGPSFETQMHTRYATSVFDVLQNYHGLPLLDKLNEDSQEPTVKLSLANSDSAAPRDDPRFVIWGDVHKDADAMSMSAYETNTDISSMQSSMSRRKSNRGRGAQPLPELRVPSSDGTKRVLMAATIERWLAQLTSTLNYDELLIFFLTYRTYIDAVDLCQLFITRFHWALEVVISKKEQQVRGTVRIRTFVAIRYWLLTFFRVDFLPNRELCLLFANWLNTLRRDPILSKFKDAADIVRRLKRVTRECKELHSRSPKSQLQKQQGKAKSTPSVSRVLGDLSNGNFAASLRKIVDADDDSDVDLDFNVDQNPMMYNMGIQGFASFANQLDLPSDNAVSGSSASRQAGTTSRIMLRQPVHMTILQHAMGGPTAPDLPSVQPRTALPVHHSAISRVVVNTIGRLGRWKRVLRSSLAPASDASIIDVDTGEFIAIGGRGARSFQRAIESSSTTIVEPVAPKAAKVSVTSPPEVHDEEVIPRASEPEAAEQVEATPNDESPPVVDIQATANKPDDDVADRRQSTSSEAYEHIASPPVVADEDVAIRHPSYDSMASVSTQSLEEPPEVHRIVLPPPNPSAPSSSRSSRAFETVNVDDLELSDSPDDEAPALPPGLPRMQRRLPRRRDFEFVRRSRDSVSSMGIITYRSSVASERSGSVTSSSSNAGFGGATMPQWQVNAIMDDLSDDDEDPGDAEAALRRLEGQINQQRQQAKVAKVDGWVRTIQERMANGDFGDDQPRFPVDTDHSDDDLSDDDYGANAHSREFDVEDVTISQPLDSAASQAETSNTLGVPTPGDIADTSNVITPTAQQTTHKVGKPSPSHVVPASEAKPKVEEAVPSEILESRLPSRSPNLGASSPEHKKIMSPTRANFALNSQANVHRSFVLAYRSDDIAQHLAYIEREIFLGIEFKELMSEDWMASCDRLNVLDWSQFLRDRRHKVELHGKGTASALVAARARFNLVANFVLSEIVLSQYNSRPVIVNKFIRIAWKAYLRNNFATMVAIITGLTSDYTKKALGRSWNRIGIWETRILDDLKVFSTHEDDFHHIRHAIAALSANPNAGGQRDDSTASASMTDSMSSASKGKAHVDGRPSQPQSCIPFLGVYLSQLHRLSYMPDLIDPSAPNETVRIDPDTGNFEAPSHSEVFSDLESLPPSMQLEPLINVQKQRLIANVIKALVAGQHLANKYTVKLDKKLFLRCLRLRALDSDTINRVLSLYPENT